MTDGAVGGVEVKKKKKGLPKLNVAPSMLSQKGVGQYFNDPNCKPTPASNPKKMRKVSESKALLEKKDKRNSLESESSSVKKPSQIPGLMLQGPNKPQTLNIDLKSFEQPLQLPTKPRPKSSSTRTNLERDLEYVIGNMITKERERKSVYLNKFDGLSDDELFESDSEEDAAEVPSRKGKGDDHSLFYQLPELPESSAVSPAVSPPPPAFQRAYRHPTELENIELLQQNISLRQENVALKQNIAMDRKTFSASIQGYSDEIQRMNIEFWQLRELLEKNENVLVYLREMILTDKPQMKTLCESESQTEGNLGDLFMQVSKKLETLKASAKSLSTSQNMAEGRMLQLDFEVKKLREENLKFRKYVEKFRGYFMLFDQF